jgi:hypothetical protein
MGYKYTHRIDKLKIFIDSQADLDAEVPSDSEVAIL